MVACALAILGLTVSAVVIGSPSGWKGYLDLTAIFVASVIFLHQLAMHVLPAARGRSHGEPGISERGVAYGVSPIPGWFNRIDIHLNPKRSRRHDEP